MAKPDNSGRVIMITFALVGIFFLLRYLIRETTRFIPIHEYLLWAIALFQFTQLYYFFTQSHKRFRKERKGEVRYQIYLPPQYKSMVVTFALGLLCCGLVLFLNTDSMNRVIGMVITFAVFLGPGFYRVFYVIDHGRAYIKLTGESFICFRRGKELKILWHEIEWVDYITKVMDIRRGYEKIGIVFKLLNGREIELDTWGWGFGQDDVTNLMRDISVKIKHQDQT